MKDYTELAKEIEANNGEVSDTTTTDIATYENNGVSSLLDTRRSSDGWNCDSYSASAQTQDPCSEFWRSRDRSEDKSGSLGTYRKLYQ